MDGCTSIGESVGKTGNANKLFNTAFYGIFLFLSVVHGCLKQN